MTYSVWTTTLPPSPYNTTGTITISSTGSGYYSGTVLTSAGSNGTMWSNNINVTQPSLSVSGSANIAGDLTVKGVSILETLEKINERLAILVPDPDRLEKFKALKNAYENYKTLEALCYTKDKE